MLQFVFEEDVLSELHQLPSPAQEGLAEAEQRRRMDVITRRRARLRALFNSLSTEEARRYHERLRARRRGDVLSERFHDILATATRCELLRILQSKFSIRQREESEAEVPTEPVTAESTGQEDESRVLTSEEREAAMDRFAEEQNVDRRRVMWTPYGPQIRLGEIAQESINVSDIPPEWSNQQIWELVRSGEIRGVPITDEIRDTDWYRTLWNNEFQLMGLRDMLGVMPQNIPLFGPLGPIVDNFMTLEGNLSQDRPTVSFTA